MQGRRHFTTGFLAALPALAFAGRAAAQYYPQPGYPPRYPDDDERHRFDERRRFEERRRYEDRRREEEFRGGPPREGGVYGVEQERNRRVLRLQQQLQQGQIGRREFEGRVAEIDRELHERLEGR